MPQAIVARPTLLFGLGGTGLQVLYRLRRRILDHYGSCDALPIVQFLWVDTAPSSELRVRSDVGLAPSQEFAPTEMVDAGIPDATNLYQGIGQGNYPHYASWFSLDELKTETNVSEGAGAIRQLGRVAFTYHYDTITEKLSAAARQACRDESRQTAQEALGAPTASGLRVVVCSSIAGGTGSGMFLDAAYLAQRLDGTDGVSSPLEVTGILALPGAFVENRGQDRRNANAYAALKELNYFSYHPGGHANPLGFLFGDTTFRAAYKQGAEADRVEHNHAPFDECYLVDIANLGGVNVTAERVMDVIADYLFASFSSPLVDGAGAVGVDMAMRIGQATDGRDMPMRFFSLGMSTQLFPRAQIVEALACRLASDVAKNWGKQWREVTTAPDGDGPEAVKVLVEYPDPLVGTVRTHIMSTLLPQLGLSQKADGTGGFLDPIGLVNGNPLVNRPGAWANEITRRIETENWETDESWGVKLEEARKTEDANYTTFGDDLNRWGYRIRQIVTNRDRLRRGILGQLREHVTGLMATSSQGPDWALCMLEQLKSRLRDDADKLHKQAGDAGFIAQLLGDLTLITDCRADGQGRPLSNIIEDGRNEYYRAIMKVARSFLSLYRQRHLEGLTDKYLHWAQMYQRAKLLEAARLRAAEGLQSLCQDCDSIAEDVREAWATMRQMQQELAKEAEVAAQKVPTTPIAGEVVYNKDLEDALYTQLLTSAPDADLDKLTKGLLEGFDVTWITLPQKVKLDPELRDKMLQKLQERCREIAGVLSTDTGLTTNTGAVDMLCSLYGDKALTNRLNQTWNQAAPYVSLVDLTADGGWQQADLQSRAVAGVFGGYFEDDPDPERARVNGLLLNQDGLTATSFIDSGLPDRVVILREASGFPLRALTAAQQWKQQYDRVIADKKQRPLHGWKQDVADAFPDLYPPDSLGDVYLCVDVGQAIGVVHPINIRDEDGAVAQILGYSYALASGVTDEVPLGTDPHAARVRLCREPELVATLVGEIQKFAEAADADERKAMAQKLRELLSARLAEVQGDRQHPAYTTLLKVVNDFAVKHGLSLAAE